MEINLSNKNSYKNPLYDDILRLNPNLIEEEIILLKNIIYEVITGSTSYGTDIHNEIHESDEDIKAVGILPLKNILTLKQPIETICIHNPSDYEIHELKKFMKLCRENNPTITEMLWTEERFIKHRTVYSDMLRDNREAFLSKRCIYSFGGYAMSQLHEIQCDLGLNVTEREQNIQLTNALTRLVLSFNGRYKPFDISIRMEDDNLYLDMGGTLPLKEFVSMNKEVENCVKTYNKIKHRSNKKSLPKLYKHAMHLVRLLLSAIELCESGKLIVYREKDKQLLLDIRNGVISFEDIFIMVAQLNEKLLSFTKNCILPDKPNDKLINEMYFDIVSSMNRELEKSTFIYK